MDYVGVVRTNGHDTLWTVYVPGEDGLPLGVGAYAPRSYAETVAGGYAQRLGLKVEVSL